MEGYVATIGMFDGVHLGHQFVIRQVVQCARERGLLSMALTFDHTVRREAVLTPLDEKLRLLNATGLDRVEVLPFTRELKSLTAREFMQQVLKEQLHVCVLMTGYDNRFGHNREEGFDDYVYYGRELGIEVVSLPPAPSEGGGGVVSSSYIRQLLSEGRVEEASRCLGHPYLISGHVEHGEHVGTGLGYPTANLVADDPNQLIPANGVYAVQVFPPTASSSSMPYMGMMNIGTRPTFGVYPQTLEVHLLHYHGDLYGQRLGVSFVGLIREERRFDHLEALKRQLQQDAIQAERIINNRK